MGQRWARWSGHEGSQSPEDDPHLGLGDPIPRMKAEGVHGGGGDEDGDGCPSPRMEGEDEDGLEEQRKDDPRRMRPNNPRKGSAVDSNRG